MRGPVRSTLGRPEMGFNHLRGTHMKGSTSSWAVSATILSSIIAQPQLLRANPLSPPSGSYELTARLELPHLERWGVDKSTIICLSNSPRSDEIPVPVVSANNPFAKCSVTNLVADGSRGSNTTLFAANEDPRGVTLYTSFRPTHSMRIGSESAARRSWDPLVSSRISHPIKDFWGD